MSTDKKTNIAYIPPTILTIICKITFLDDTCLQLGDEYEEYTIAEFIRDEDDEISVVNTRNQIFLRITPYALASLQYK